MSHGDPSDPFSEPTRPLYDPGSQQPTSPQQGGYGFGQQQPPLPVPQQAIQSYGTPGQPYGTPPGQPYGTAPGYPPVVTAIAPPTSGKAVLSLVLGIAGLFFIWTFGAGGIVFGLPAVLLGRSAKRDIDRDPAHVGGRGVAGGGFVTGMIGLIIGGIGVLISLLFMGAILSMMGIAASQG